MNLAKLEDDPRWRKAHKEEGRPITGTTINHVRRWFFESFRKGFRKSVST